MKISERANNIQASPIRKLMPYAAEARKKGKTVYPLNIGQPDLPTPEPMINAIREFDKNILSYSPSQGEEFLLEAFSSYYKQNNIALDPTDIIVTIGGSEAIFFALLCICDPHDEIIVFEPFYTNYNGIALETDVKLVPIPTYAEDGFQLPSASVIEKAITPKTKAILVCNPNNPTGTVYPKESIVELANLVKKHNIFLMADEVYREFTYDGLTHTSIMHVPGMENHAILLDSVSKRYSACGARIGVIASKNKALMAACLKFAQARLSAPLVEQWATKAALMMQPSYFAPVLAEYQKRRDTVMESLSTIKDVICKTPKGAFYVIAKLPIKDADRFARWLLTDFDYEGATVLVAPVAGFYASKDMGKDEIRISYVLEVDKLKKAMEALAKAIPAYQKIENSEPNKEMTAGN